jgi:non-heme chloroperoxidase
VQLDDGHRVIMYELRGLGGSSQPTAGCDLDTLAADVRTLMDVEVGVASRRVS